MRATAVGWHNGHRQAYDEVEMEAHDSQIAARAWPADLQAILDELERTDQQARQLVAELSDAQLNWRPGDGARWSVAQCLDHLGQCNKLYVGALKAAARKSSPAALPRRGPIKPGWLGRLFIKELEPPPKRKIKAQEQVMPASKLDGGEVMKAFIAAHDEVRALIVETRELDLNRIRFRNPFLRLLPWTIGTGLLVIGAHDRRHLWQANQVRAAMQA